MIQTMCRSIHGAFYAEVGLRVPLMTERDEQVLSVRLIDCLG